MMDVTSSLEAKRRLEVARYEDLISGKIRTRPDQKTYGDRNNGSDAWPQLETFSIQSLVDVGTGNGAFPRQAAEKGIRSVAGVDFASLPNGQGVRWFKAPAHDLPFDDGDFQWLTSFDMLEHLIPGEVDEVLDEFRRVSSVGWLFSISYRKSHTQLDWDLHLTVRPKDWWKEKLGRYGDVAEFTDQYLWLRFR